ncbi:MAG: DUF1073 domain-containing protein [Colwellia sp.]|nr:DUF1073 domain-containing protein [Colwellia sp.]
MFNFFKKKPETNTFEYTADMKKADGYFGMLLNQITSTIRRGFGGGTYGVSPDGKRDYNILFGYGTDLFFSDYYNMFKRGGIAGTVVEKVAKACWRDLPEIKVGDDVILEKELRILKNRGMFKALERADILNRIGNFSVLLIGIPDGTDLHLPLGSARKDDFKSLYFNPYNYDGIEITKWDTDAASVRFGLPELYQLQTTNINQDKNKEAIFTSHVVHWSRVVHMAEGALDSSVEGRSSLQQPWNCLIDKDKVRGGSGEAYYRNARQKLALEVDKDATIDNGTEALKGLKENVENFQNGYEDVLRLNKMKANMLQPGLASPRDAFDIAVEEVSGVTGIPIRILLGKGTGQLAGTEDKAAWNALILDRQEQECQNWLLRALSILADAGILDLPEDSEVEYSPQKALTQLEESTIMVNKATAFKTVIDGLSTAAADELAVESVFEEIGLKIEVENISFDDEEDDESLKDDDGNPLDDKDDIPEE